MAYYTLSVLLCLSLVALATLPVDARSYFETNEVAYSAETKVSTIQPLVSINFLNDQIPNSLFPLPLPSLITEGSQCSIPSLCECHVSLIFMSHWMGLDLEVCIQEYLMQYVCM